MTNISFPCIQSKTERFDHLSSRSSSKRKRYIKIYKFPRITSFSMRHHPLLIERHFSPYYLWHSRVKQSPFDFSDHILERERETPANVISRRGLRGELRKRFDKRAKRPRAKGAPPIVFSSHIAPPVAVSRLRRSLEIEFRQRARLSNSSLRFLAERSYVRKTTESGLTAGIYSTSRRKKGTTAAAAAAAARRRRGGGFRARTKGRDHRHQPKARNYGD